MSGFLYHATWPGHEADIAVNGLVPGSDGVVYLAGPELAHAAVFLAIRPGEFKGHKKVIIGGETVMVPDYEEHEKLVVFKIPRSALDPEKLSESFDHSASFFPDDLESFVYDGTIDVFALDCDMYEVELNR
jgi:hypothetical protein